MIKRLEAKIIATRYRRTVLCVSVMKIIESIKQSFTRAGRMSAWRQGIIVLGLSRRVGLELDTELESRLLVEWLTQDTSSENSGSIRGRRTVEQRSVLEGQYYHNRYRAIAQRNSSIITPVGKHTIAMIAIFAISAKD